MAIDGIDSGFTVTGVMDKQTLGAQVVSKTLDVMNNVGGVGDALSGLAFDKQTFGAQVVGKTLDYMNSDQSGAGLNADYDFQTKVLSAGMLAKGGLTDTKI